ncbi:MAG: hypothetical protein ABSD72_10665 [Terracidiphilus sp.]|jgi:hypothetical protein
MNRNSFIPSLLILSFWGGARAQDAPPPEKSRADVRYSLSVIDDATFYGDRSEPVPEVLNQMLVEPALSYRFHDRLTLASSMIGLAGTHSDNYTQLRIKETYARLSAGDFDFTLGRKMVRWGTGYAFSAAGVLDPPRVPTDPTDRLNLNEGRDMVKADWVRGPHAFSLAWSTAALAPADANLHDTTAFRYNVLVRGFDTSLIAGNDRGGDSFGALTFTRVLGQAWEVHGETVWREQAAVLLGAKYTVSGITFIGEFFTPPNIPYYNYMGLSPLAGRQHYAFLTAGKARLRERPGWKEWGLSGSVVANLDDHSYTPVIDASRWFGNHFSSYLHMEIPKGSKTSQYGSAPYSTATSVGVRFQI